MRLLRSVPAHLCSGGHHWSCPTPSQCCGSGGRARKMPARVEVLPKVGKRGEKRVVLSNVKRN